jgi:hypothetical protein
MLSPGQDYKFKYRAINIFGVGAFSAESTIKAASKPDQISEVVQTVVNADLRITWAAPNERGSQITVYQVYVVNGSGDDVEHTDCNALETMCSIVFSDFIDTYGLVEGQDIHVKVTATNGFGTSDISVVDLTSVKAVQTVPHKPLAAPTRGELLTTQTQIQVLIEAFATEQTGGSQILSYIVSWD